MSPAFKIGLYFLGVVCPPLVTGVFREIKLSSQRGILIVSLHSLASAVLYSATESGFSEFPLTFIFFVWFDYFFYSIGRVGTLAVQGRFIAWIKSMTPEQRFIRAMAIATFAVVIFIPGKAKTAHREGASIEETATPFNAHLTK